MGMKINLIGMILNNAGKRAFDGIIIDDDGKTLDAVHSLDHMIMEYAKVRYGGTSETVVVPDGLSTLTPVALWDAEAPQGMRWTSGFMRGSFPDGAPVVVMAPEQLAEG